MPAFIFDLDGTLVDSVYQHVMAWHSALRECGFDLSIWRIHRRIGMSGGLMIRALARELEMPLDEAVINRLNELHEQEFKRRIPSISPLPGARELLAELRELKIPYVIATSGTRADAGPMLELLGRSGEHIITREDVKRAKPDPDLFLTAAKKLHAKDVEAMVVGDSVWDMLAARRANFLGVGVLSGGYGQQELEQAGAFRVYADPDEMRRHLDELGVREE
ncbi:MAG TPA: HAD family hydrolase [Candidatus Rubrimentiphilum sp.]|nr:HAD family hydrolase [Candidatus Rubrimentiphilum sp.]